MNMNKEKLNEKLATEVMGAKFLDGMQPLYSAGEPVFDGHWHIFVSQWNPTTDLNQLRMCYETAEAGDEMFKHQFYRFLKVYVVSEIAVAWVKHPELVAEAILKAKGVI